ncbi:MAG: PHP domain-containing protein [Bacilli bacterium]|nr:PHP domain-containing protein [Bacilli bacterium]
METYKDMHIHSTYSDGSLKIPVLLEQLSKKNIGTFAITDHDSLDSVRELKALGSSLEWYSGIEVSTIYNHHKIHLLGYGFDENNAAMIELVEWIKKQRQLRFYGMVKKAEKEFQLAIPISYFQQLEKEGTILVRPHLMRYLVKQGCGDSSDIMDRIENSCISKIPYRVNLMWAIEALKKAKALLLIAHPKEIEKESHIAFETIIDDLIKLGIDGIEVFHSIHTDADVKRYHDLALKYHLLESGGSDYHGPDRKGRTLGQVTKSEKKVKQLSLVQELRDRR